MSPPDSSVPWNATSRGRAFRLNPAGRKNAPDLPDEF
jgi:hypothetical protein